MCACTTASTCAAVDSADDKYIFSVLTSAYVLHERAAVYIHDTTAVGTYFAMCTSTQKSVTHAVAYWQCIA